MWYNFFQCWKKGGDYSVPEYLWPNILFSYYLKNLTDFVKLPISLILQNILILPTSAENGLE
jgi:hypothetical protein